jgi:hypothetical protein
LTDELIFGTSVKWKTIFLFGNFNFSHLTQLPGLLQVNAACAGAGGATK